MIPFQQHYGVYKGIVIDNYDKVYPQSGRLQVFVPEMHAASNQAIFKGGTLASFNFIGDNIETSLTQDVVEYLKSFCPWAVQCTPITSDYGPGFYDAAEGKASTTENPCISLSAIPNQAQNFNTPEGRRNTFAPFSNPGQNFVQKADAFAFTRPPSLSNLPKGNFTIPRVGAPVVIQFLNGDMNYPVVMGGLPTIAQYQQIFTETNSNKADNQTSPIKPAT